MATAQQYLKFLPTLADSPTQSVWLSYDSDADVLYVQFKQPSIADDSELTDDDIIIRYEGDEIIGYTILHARQRGNDS